MQGISTRKVASVIYQLCGTATSAMQVNRAAKMPDEELEGWRNRLLAKHASSGRRERVPFLKGLLRQDTNIFEILWIYALGNWALEKVDLPNF